MVAQRDIDKNNDFILESCIRKKIITDGLKYFWRLVFGVIKRKQLRVDLVSVKY